MHFPSNVGRHFWRRGLSSAWVADAVFYPVNPITDLEGAPSRAFDFGLLRWRDTTIMPDVTQAAAHR